MNKKIDYNHSGRQFGSTRTRLGLIAAVALMLTAIMATTLDAYVRTGGSGRETIFGPIEDFGSIVVNGVHYDESTANIVVDGVPGLTRASLKLGMIVQIDGVRDYTVNTSVANVVRTDHVLYGQVEDVNAAKAEVIILQQHVSVTTTTRFDGASGLGELAPGVWVAVHGLGDPGRKAVVATLIEVVSAPIETTSSIRGTVQKVKAGWMRIGKLDMLVFDSKAEDGDFVSAKGDYLGGVFVSNALVVTREVETHENVDTELQGYVADFRGIDAFTIAGVTIDATNASFSGGRASNLKQNVRVTVEGPIRNGILIAEEVEFSAAPTSVEIEGVITTFTSLADFTAKGRRIDASNIAVGASKVPSVGWKAHVKGDVAADGSVKATKAEFEPN